MQLRKVIAAGIGTVMLGSTIAIAASDLKDFPKPFVSDSTVDMLIVVGKTAATSDVVGAIDLAARLGGAPVTTETVPVGVTTAVTVNGKTRDIAIDRSNISALEGDIEEALGIIIKDTKVPYLKRGSISYNGSTYDYHEEIILNLTKGVTTTSGKIENAPSEDTTNSTIYFTIDKQASGVTGADIAYVYKFDKTIPSPGLGVQYPVSVKILNKDLEITGTTTNSFNILTGNIGTLDLDNLEKTLGDYTVKLIGFDSAARLKAKYTITKGANSVTTDLLNDTDGEQTYMLGTETVKFKVLKQESWIDTAGVTHWTAKVIVGAATETTITCGTTDYKTPYYRYDCKFSGTNQINSGDWIGVYYYNSENATYVKLGEKFNFDDYVELGIPDLTISEAGFKKVTIEPTGSATMYNATGTGTVCANCPTLTFSGATFEYGTDDYSKIYIAFNATAPAENISANIFLGKYDSALGKVVNISPVISISGKDATNVFDIIHDDTRIDVYLRGASLGLGVNKTILNLTVSGIASIPALQDQIYVTYEHNTAAGKIFYGQNSSDHRGLYLDGVEIATETTEGFDTGKNSFAYGPLSDYGILVEKPYANSYTDKIVLYIPPEQVKVRVAVGKIGATTAAGEVTTQTVVPIKTAVAKLDSEVGDAEKTAKNLILVGGPCVNTLVADLAKAGKFDYDCAGWPGENFALIKIIDDAFATGKAALVVAGTRAEDTRDATTALQQYDVSPYSGKIKGTKVKVVGTTVTEVA